MSDIHCWESPLVAALQRIPRGPNAEPSMRLCLTAWPLLSPADTCAPAHASSFLHLVLITACPYMHCMLYMAGMFTEFGLLTMQMGQNNILCTHIMQKTAWNTFSENCSGRKEVDGQQVHPQRGCSHHP